MDTLFTDPGAALGIALLWGARLVIGAGALLAVLTCAALMGVTTIVVASRLRGQWDLFRAETASRSRASRAVLGRRRGPA